MTTTMRHVQVTSWGGPDVLTMVEVPIPVPGPGELLIKAASIGVNPVDWKTRAGHGIAGLLPRPEETPVVLGWDVAGTVVDTGPDTTGFAVGDAVYGLAGFPKLGRTYAEYVAVQARDMVPVPRTVSVEDAAAVPLVALTAWQALIDIAHIQAGQRLLVHAGAGGVGHMAIQIARHVGAEVYATASAANQDFVHELGATPIDYRAVDFSSAVQDVDLVIDTIGGEIFTRSLDVLAPGSGRIISVPDPTQLGEAHARNIRADWVFVHPDRYQLEQVSALIDSGVIKPHIDRRYSLEKLAEAHSYGERGHVRGKLIVNPTVD